MTGHPFAFRAFRLLLRLYPGEFKQEYGHELDLAFRDHWRESRGAMDRAGVVVRTFWGILTEAPEEHLRILVRDIRLALHGISKDRLASAIIVTTMAMALGANASMLGILDQLLLRPIAGVQDPSRVVRVYGKGFWTAMTRSWSDYLDLRDGSSAFSAVAAYQAARVPVATQAVRKRRVERVTPSYFTLLGIKAESGRLFNEPLDGGPNPPPIAVISYAFWQSEFAGDREVVGQTLRIAGLPNIIVGVAPVEFTGVDTEPTSIWTPLGELKRDRGNYGAVNVIGRLRPGLSLPLADREANRANQQGLAADGLKPNGNVMQLGPLPVTQGPGAPKEIRVSIWLAVAAGVVLLMGWLNVTQILTARAFRRAQETAIRLALGASRVRLLRQWISESLLLAVFGGVASIAVTALATRFVYRLLLPELAVPASRLGWRELMWAAGLTLLSGMLTGIRPAWHSFHGSLLADLAQTRRNSAYGNDAHHVNRFRSGLVIAQIALAVVLLVGAALFVRSLDRVRRIDAGFDLDHLLVAYVDDQATRDLPAPKRDALYQDLAERARQLPGIAAAGLAHSIPGESAWRTRFYIPGRDSQRFFEDGGAIVNRLSTFAEPAAMSALNLHLRRGRWFTSLDRAGAEPVAIVNEQLAHEIWPQHEALGQCLALLNPGAPCTRVVGVVNNTRVESWFDEPPAQYYLPLAQPVRDESAAGILIRVTGNPAQGLMTVQRELQKISPATAFVEVRMLSVTIDPVLRPWRLAAQLFSAFGFLALTITAVGIFGLLSYVIAQRSQEWSVRQALGATRRDIAGRVLSAMLRIAIPGLLCGALLAWTSTRWVKSLLYGLGPNDAVSYLTAAALVLALAFAASIIPIRRATSLDLAAQLRQE